MVRLESPFSNAMPFSSDTSWPTRLKTFFESSRSTGGDVESRYCGAYDKMLNYCFGEEFDFFVTPQAQPGKNTKQAVDFVVFLIIALGWNPTSTLPL
jgi:hypothetical protein